MRIGEKEDIRLRLFVSRNLFLSKSCNKMLDFCPKFYRGGKTKFLMVDSSKGLSINVVKS